MSETPNELDELVERLSWDAVSNKDTKNKIVDVIRRSGGSITIREICKKTSIPAKTVLKIIEALKEDGYDIVDQSEMDKTISLMTVPRCEHNYHAPSLWDENPLKLGLISDTHLGISPEYSAIDELRRTLEIFAERGVSTVLHAGDLTHGTSARHPGLEYEMAPGVVGADDQVKYVVDNYPRIDGIKTLFITGSHDLWVYKKSGFDVGRAIEIARDDMQYLGPERAHIFVGPEKKTRITLHHPDGGSSYAMSYRPQKLVEAMTGGEKPHIYILGHFHRFGIFRPRNVITIMLPGFQWNSPFYQRKGLEPEVGGVYLEVDLSEDGGVILFRTELIPYYREPILPSNIDLTHTANG